MSADVDRHVLRLAAAKLGGHVELRRFLDIPCGQLLRWMAGLEPLPGDICLKLLSVIFARKQSRNRDSASLAP